ncbi:MAG TPA: ArsR family transcriptional regulator [Methanoregulaceae archaeon]|jgi:ArsR family transcriptional regulator|nr:ArsR family transcriptional regulator [Methanoregulaceae archaeon]HOW33583.1 ArsR family transcriptional regulator [Methanoregulaceae archaeon]
MLDHVEVARILDILGNRNRRRIIELLRQKPCFVTEISDRLTLSPKAVIEHLQLMEREEILSFRLDDRRRKYYYLANDISVMVSLHRLEEGTRSSDDVNNRLRKSLGKLRKLVDAREELAGNLRNIEKDIDLQIREIVQQGREVLEDDSGIDLLIALAHCNLTGEELAELTGQPVQNLAAGLAELRKKHIVEQEGPTFRLCGINAE